MIEDQTLFEKKKKEKVPAEKVTSADIKGLLGRKYPSGGFAAQYAFFTEVRNGTGAYFGRSADALVMNMYPSQGHEVIGFEIKVNRGDWLNELKDATKAEAVMQYCDRWYIIAPPGVVDEREVPKNWGYMEVKHGKIFTKIKAPLLDPVPFTRTFISSLLRLAQKDVVNVDVMHTAVKDEYMRGVKDTEKKAQESAAKLEEYRRMVAIFEEKAGIQVIKNWDGIEHARKIGTLVRFILDGGIRSMKWDVDSALERAREAVKELEKVKEFSEAAEDLNKL